MTQEKEKLNNTVENLMEEGRNVVKKANKRHVIIRKADGTTLVDLSVTVLAVIIFLMFWLQPFGTIAAIAAIAYGLYSKVKIEVVHELGADDNVVEVNLPHEDE